MTEYNNDEYEEDFDKEDNDTMVICFGENGKAEVKMFSELEEIKNNQIELITEFIKENLESFNLFLEKKGLTEYDFNKGIIEKSEVKE